MQTAVPVHNHSEFSALDGFSTVDEIAGRLAAINATGGFITDHGIIAGWRSFAEAMRKRDLIPGLGMEAYQSALAHRSLRPEKKNSRDAHHLLLLAKNDTGVKNLMRLADEANRSGFYFSPRVDWELLEEFHEGLVCTSACMAGLVTKGIRNDDHSAFYRYLDIFGDDFFVEIHTYATDEQKQINDALVSLAREHGAPLVYANDAHYACHEDYDYHELMLCMQMNKWYEDEDRMSHPDCLYIMDEADVRSHLDYLDESVLDECVANSAAILEACKDAHLPEVRMHLPVFRSRKSTGDKNNKMLLLRLVEEGCERRYGDITEEIEDRAIYELDTIFTAGLTDYFLITWDFCTWADNEGIERGPGRGSAGGSLVAYALGITDVDPLEYDLYFERFYNAGREKGLPDIDIDFEVRRRAEVDKYLRSRYGEFAVIPIGTHIRMKPKSVIDKAAKAIYGPDLNYADITQIKKIIDGVPDINIMSADQIGWYPGDGIKVSVFGDEPTAKALGSWVAKYPELFDAAEKLGGRLSTYGVHASAVIISDVDVRENLPAMWKKGEDGKEKVFATQIEMREVEKIGFPKFDRLGLRNLDTLKRVSDLVGGVDYRAIDWKSLPEDFWMLMDKGRTLGLFQVEEGMARNIGQKLKPRSILDLAAIVSLNRPGPLRSGVVERFIARRNGEQDVVYAHPLLETFLAETYGDFLYQEQVIAYFRAIGYDLKEADGIRKMLGKKLASEMDAEFPRYQERASTFMAPQDAEEIWESIVDFSKYSFNKSHAVAYAIILARTMYAKWKYPAEFIIASIQTNPGEVGDYITEGRRLGVTVNPPDVNKSEHEIRMIDGEIWFGLSEVKGVGKEAARWIVQRRPYTSYEQFLEALETEAKEWKGAPESERSRRSPKQICPAGMVKHLRNAGAFDTISPRDISDEEKMELETELMGVAVTDVTERIVEQHEDELRGLDDYEYANDCDPGTPLRVPGIISTVRPYRTKTNKMMGFVKMEWEGEDLEFSVAPKYWSDHAPWLLKPMTVGIFNLRRSDRGISFEAGTKLSEYKAQ